MAGQDFRTPRLFVTDDLEAGGVLSLDRGRSSYLLAVLRLAVGAPVLLFNGRQGEWRGRIGRAGRRSAEIAVEAQTRLQTQPGGVDFAFAPLKHARLDYMVQKAVEMGVASQTPVFTQHTQATRVNLERMRANVIEAAEQCGVLSVPEVREPLPFDRWLRALPPDRVLIFCDEEADAGNPLHVLSAAPRGGVTVLIGPEGGFAGPERRALLARTGTVSLSLGPRILRADTAAVAALALVQAALGDWQ